MRPAAILRFALIMCILLVLGCESNNAGKIEGTSWTSQTSTFRGKSVPGGFLKLRFYKDGGLEYKAGNLTFNGNYTLGMGDSVTFNLTKELAGRKTHVQKCVIVEDRLTV